MSDNKSIRTALVSVYHKEGLDEILQKLHREGVKFISTGGTRQFIESLGYPCDKVESITGYPSVLGGRVKTLHPKIFGGILNRRSLDTDQQECIEYDIPSIDLVIVDLYPFEDTVRSGATPEDIIEKIDIGGISLIRAAAKNFSDVVIVASQAQYRALLDVLNEQGANTTLEDRRWFAREAFAVSSGYDTAIFNWFDGSNGSALRVAVDHSKPLRYGENPHQQASFFGHFDQLFEQLNGKDISYNNLLDIDAAVSMVNDYDETTFVIVKHNNACGLASRPVLVDAWNAALSADPVSAFGGVFAANAPIDKVTAEEINKLFFEVLIAPDYDFEALEILTQKKNRILLIQKETPESGKQFRSLFNGILVQDKDLQTEIEEDLHLVTDQESDAAQIEDLLFANKIVKHNKSNAIVLAKNKQLCAAGVGQTSRVDALRQAIDKARSFGMDLDGAVMASDAFFPFPDCVEIAHEAGINAIIQPGGSINDKLSVEYCNKHNLAMYTTGYRHFKH